MNGGGKREQKLQFELKKIVAIGPESTGKSTLCEQLATHYKSRWVPEYARQFLVEHGMNYSYDDLLIIAKGQIELEDWGIQNRKDSETNNESIFIDTNMYVMKVWCEFVFNKCHQFIIDQIVNRDYDLYLLCNIDLPWSYDPLREYPDVKQRQILYRIYRDLLVNQTTPWMEISGGEHDRLQHAIDAIDMLHNSRSML
jgi:NadR type nicotinamide-nucleotide adenylyltransferase